MCAARQERVLDLDELSVKLLALINTDSPREDLIKNLILFVQDGIGFESAGLRLAKGTDYPYDFTNGFNDEFLRHEMYICSRDEYGEVLRDDSGEPILNCLCGRVIKGDFSSFESNFTPRGSFWTNSTSDFAASLDKEVLSILRNYCNKDGYESSCLVPLKVANETYGLLQLSDRRKNMLTFELICFLEGVASSIAFLFSMKQVEDFLFRQGFNDESLEAMQDFIFNHISNNIMNASDPHLPHENGTEVIDRLDNLLVTDKSKKFIIPICCECRKIKNDSGEWSHVEAYILNHSSSNFTHTYCPECFEKWKTKWDDTK